MPSLFGFAPDGVYRAGLVALAPVRSYRTLSAFPPRMAVVSSLWHFPSGRPGWPLASILLQGSPDFPHPYKKGATAWPSDGQISTQPACACLRRECSAGRLGLCNFRQIAGRYRSRFDDIGSTPKTEGAALSKHPSMRGVVPEW